MMLLVTCCSSALLAQSATLQVQVLSEDKPVEGAEVSAGSHRATTDASGRATLSLPPGSIQIVVIRDGFLPATLPITVAAGDAQSVIVELLPQPLAQLRLRHLECIVFTRYRQSPVPSLLVDPSITTSHPATRRKFSDGAKWTQWIRYITELKVLAESVFI